MIRVFGLILMMLGLWLLSLSTGTVNGGFILGAPVLLAGGFLLTRNISETEYPNEKNV